MSAPIRIAAGVLAIIGGAVALGIGFLLALVGGALEAVYGVNGNSAGVSGLLAMLFGFGAVVAAALLFVSTRKRALIVLAANMAGLLWAFARVDAAVLALIPLVPLGVALLLVAVSAAGTPAARQA